MCKRFIVDYRFNNIFLFRIIGVLLIYAAIYACNPTKRVPKDKYLLDRVEVNVDNDDVSQSELEDIIKQKANKRILWSTRFHLWLYNLADTSSKSWLSRSLLKTGEEPVIYDSLLTERTVKQMQLYLRNKGYYNSHISYDVKYKSKSLKVTYNVETGVPYYISGLDYQITDPAFRAIIYDDTTNCLIKKGQLFDVEYLQGERVRIESILNNHGYFMMSKDDVYFEADSNSLNHTVKLTLNIKDNNGTAEFDSALMLKHTLFHVRNIKVIIENHLDKDSISDFGYTTDTLMHNGIEIVYPGKVIFKPNLLVNNIYIQTNRLFSQRSVDETYKSLSSLKIFKFINIQFNNVSDSFSVDSVRKIDCEIKVALTDFQSYQTEVELTNSSGLGVAGNISYQHKNLFRGAEIFDLKLKGATEAIKKTEEFNFKNTLDLGIEARIQFPKFLLPFKIEEFTRRYNPKTAVSASYHYLRRPEYTHAVANMSFGYSWNGNKYTSFQVNPVEVNYVKLVSSTESFRKTILSSSSYLKYSFLDHLVAVSNVSFTFNNQKPKKNTSFYYFRFTAESAGNSLSLFSKITNREKGSDGVYEIYGIGFAQYLKGDVEYRYFQPVNSTDKIAYRVFLGVANPYGNSKSIPFEKQYFSGGANSIRAWATRDLGPGSYRDTSSSFYPDKSADIKIEANIEYRFKLFWRLEGALFIDSGNIWAISKNDGREGGLFGFDSFYKEIAIGTGAGMRFDFSFFMIRFDLGLKIYDPAEDAGNRWTFGKTVTHNYLNYNFGIGYPF